MKHTNEQQDALVELIRDEQRVRPYPEELTPAQEREYVEARWLQAAAHSWWTDTETAWRIYLGPDVDVPIGFDSEAAAWHAAFLFTQEREEQIRQLEEQIHDLNAVIQDLHLRRAAFSDKRQQEDIPQMFARRIIVQGRTLALLQREIEQAKQGWKG